jgi:predicted ester cyclase
MTAASNKRIMEHFTRKFLTAGDVAPAEELLGPDIDLRFARQQQRRLCRHRHREPRHVADLVWTVEEIVADSDTVAVRHTMTGTERVAFAGVAPTNKTVVAQSMEFYFGDLYLLPGSPLISPTTLERGAKSASGDARVASCRDRPRRNV